MRELIDIHIPLFGGIYLQWDTITTCHYAWEIIPHDRGRELYICAGRFRLYLTSGPRQGG